MIRTILFSSAIALAAPAMAQQATPAAEPQTAMPQQAPAQPSATPDAAAQPAAPANPATAVATIVDSEFPAYDGNKDGQLDKAEFSRWMVALKTQETKATGAALPPEQVTAWAEGAFATADADKSTNVSKPELVTFLSGGAG